MQLCMGAFSKLGAVTCCCAESGGVIAVTDDLLQLFSLVGTADWSHFSVRLYYLRLAVRRRRVTHRNSFGREKSSRRQRAPDDVNAAIVKLVRAGAPQRLLWMEPEVVDLDALPEDSPLRQEIETAEAACELRVARRGGSVGWLSAAWLGLKRLCRECLVHFFPANRAHR